MAKPLPVWYGHDHADAYLLASALHLARGAATPRTFPLPPPSVSATLYCAFAAEAYVNVALIRMLGEDEYAPASRMPVRSKYFLATKLGQGEEWFSSGEAELEALEELFTERNRLVHAQPERSIMHPFADPEAPRLHSDLRNVGRWVAAASGAAARLGRSHAELSGFDRVAGALSVHAPTLWAFDAARDGATLDAAVRTLIEDLLREDYEDSMDESDLETLLDEHDADWDVLPPAGD
ncbi:MAG: hypothetical protein JHC95_05990 [Solirubrobacteraceae bacterium]|nr:hypothetical protein [Solirubrobacteraceae bacterium]